MQRKSKTCSKANAIAEMASVAFKGRRHRLCKIVGAVVLRLLLKLAGKVRDPLIAMAQTCQLMHDPSAPRPAPWSDGCRAGLAVFRQDYIFRGGADCCQPRAVRLAVPGRNADVFIFLVRFFTSKASPLMGVDLRINHHVGNLRQQPWLYSAVVLSKQAISSCSSTGSCWLATFAAFGISLRRFPVPRGLPVPI